MADKIKNYYSKLSNSETNKPKLDKNYKQHYILPCSMILALGGTGSGKTNALISFLERKTAAFYKIIIYSGSTTDEPLYEMLKNKVENLLNYIQILKIYLNYPLMIQINNMKN